jgi:hypothetical protein
MSNKKKFIISGIAVCVVAVCFAFCGGKSSKHQDLAIVFNNSGNVSEYKTTGFSAPESVGTWTDAEVASIDIPLPEIGEDNFFMVSVDANPFVGKRLKKQTVGVFVNDAFVTNLVMTDSGVYKFGLPRDVQKSGKIVNIKFKISNPTSPKDLGLSGDMRKLGINVKTITLSVEDANNPNVFVAYKIGEKVVFSNGGNSKLYTESGWSGQEKEFTWTDGKDAYLNMFVKDAQNKSLKLVVEASATFAPADKYQSVKVYVNDKELTTWNVGAGVDKYSVIIPAEVVGTGAMRIRFNIAKPFSSKTDVRNLGLAVRNIEFSNRFGAQTKNKMAKWFKNKVADNSEPEQPAENNK